MTQGGDEVDLLRRLQAVGPVTFDRGNPTSTSSRRLHQGLVYNVLVTFLWYYLMAYWLNRLLHRQILGMAPAFGRTAASTRRQRSSLRTATVLAATLIGLAVIGWLDLKAHRA